MAIGKAISLFLIDGVPDGRVACELFNWTGKAFKIPRRLVKESADRSDLHKAGVYFLFGRDDSKNEVNSAYIGEAEDVIRRVPQHHEKEFWTEALIFISKDENLNRAHIKFLEYQIHERAAEVGRYDLQNSNTPNLPAISEVDQAVMMEFFDNLQLLVGAMGYKIFEPLVNTSVVPNDRFFIQAARGANARAVYGSEGMVVLRGSEAAFETVPSTPRSYILLRESLLLDGILVSENGKLIFSKDHLFSSASTAAGVVLGRSANGLIEWKTAEGRLLRDCED